jgi:hypothetical protein
MARFVAVDGEADNRGRYIIMCDSLGRVLHDPEGIGTQDALDFILAIPKGFEVVCYGLNYDSNQWMCDLSRSNLERLASEGDHRATWRGEYKLEWIPSKMFTVSVPGKSVTVCEVFGFFQTSFVKALAAWGIEQPAEIETMKQKRGTFTAHELKRVIHYCQAECKLLVEVMERLQDACNIAGCAPRRRWIGAGSIATSLLTSKGVKEHHAHDLDVFGSEDTESYVLGAYFGGRVELYQQGWVQGALVEDVRSAYPYGATHAPSLKDAEVSHHKCYDPSMEFAIYHVRWNANPDCRVTPFPVRLPSGQICYPLSGEGYYHAREVQAALRFPEFHVDVLDGIALHPATDEKPFAWIPELYEQRKKFKAAGSYAEKALKLGLNSVYGKTAQGYGFGGKPPYQSYYWAGFITSYTRARVLERLAREPRPVMCATDGVVTQNGKRASDSNDLGTWERDSYERIATIQPGVYVADVGGERIVKSRGFFARDVDYDELVSQFYKDPLSAYHFDSRRFIGLKVALHRKDFNVWRTWPNERRSIAFEINNKRRVQLDNGNVELWPIAGPFTSLPYVPKQSLYDDPTDAMLENMVRDDQPHREVD